jgi:murein L,D-transpeptidase YcbB/YkuD
VPLIDKRELLEGFLAARSPQGYLRGLAPQSPEYTRLMRRQLELRAQIETGGWGPTVTGGALRPGDTGDRVVTLRNRLMAMGYLGRSVTQTYEPRSPPPSSVFRRPMGSPSTALQMVPRLRRSTRRRANGYSRCWSRWSGNAG